MNLHQFTKDELLIKCEELGIITNINFSKSVLITRIKQFNLEKIYNSITNNSNENKFTTASISFETDQENFQKNIDIINNFDLIYKPATRMVWIKSTNGFLAEISYKKEEYETTALLKSSKQSKNDNLLYEGIVGLFINKQTKKFPCFVETYGLYCYNNLSSYVEMCAGKYIDPLLLQNDLTKIVNIDKSAFDKAVTNSRLFTIIIQNLKNYKTLKDLLENNNDFIINDLLYILFQIYAALSALALEFTHYDLHTGNVLIYELEENSYIEYHYKTKRGEIVSFKCKYIAKIIDYGRCYFNDKTDTGVTSSSKKIYEQLLEIPTFSDNKEDQGFEWFDSVPDSGNYFISSIYANVSHDLRLLNHIKLYNRDKIKEHNPIIYKILKYVKYGEGIINKNKEYGTKENMTLGFPYINNVLDVWIHLSKNVMKEKQKEKNQAKYTDLTKLGDLYIYLNTDKPMDFIPVK